MGRHERRHGTRTKAADERGRPAGAGWRPPGRRGWPATSDATPHEATRLTSVSARLVRMIGTRAPSTMPALSAPARNDRLFASMLPASRSGTTRILAPPANGEAIFLI